MVVTVDDSLPVVAGVNSPEYTTVLFAPGAFGYGTGVLGVPSEMDREPSHGYGGGEDILYTRRNPIIQPAGFSFVATPATGTTATLAELATATSWDRVLERKNCGIAFLKHNN